MRLSRRSFFHCACGGLIRAATGAAEPRGKMRRGRSFYRGRDLFRRIFCPSPPEAGRGGSPPGTLLRAQA